MDCLNLSFSAVSMLLGQAAVSTAANDGISGKQYIALLIFAAVLVVPFLLGRWLSKALRMPDYATPIGLILLALIASLAVLFFGKMGLGVDLRGGTILVYEIDPTKSIGANDDTQAPDGSTSPNRIASSKLIPSLIKRINPSGTQEIAIRPYGENQIEIIIPEVDQREVDRIKEVISTAGILRFAILANTRDHQRLIEIARAQANEASQRNRLSRTILDSDGKTPIGFWALVDREDSKGASDLRPFRVDVSQSILRNPADGRILEVPPGVVGVDGLAQWVKSVGLENIQVLMVIDQQLDVTGEDLAFASSGFDNDGSPAVRFKLNDSGSGRFLALTTNNAPDGQHRRQLGIVLDEMLLSAPAIQSPISGDGQITGNFTNEEVSQLVRILEAGQLPAALTKEPIAENQIDATLGADTIRKGLIAIAVSLALVLLFMLYYYRFSGLNACIALVLNLLLTVAFMILINQPMTLPGLAGLVLTIGMAVDANILIFERIREERQKGAAPRMAIRNGFSRATTTIVDSNLTTLITAIVLYAVGTDQIRGFAVTLILGILFSMFTAIYVSRTIFDIAERKGFLSLSMSDMLNDWRRKISGGEIIDFMRLGPPAILISLALIGIGLAAMFARGKNILDIDFAGGSSVTFRLAEATTTDAVRAVVGKSLADIDGQKIDFTVNNVSMDSAPSGTIFKVDSSIDDVDKLKSMLGQGFAADGSLKMVTYDLKITPADLPKQGSLRKSTATTLVAMRPQDQAAAPAATEAKEAADKPAEAATPTPAAAATSATEPAAATPEAPATPAATPPADPAAPPAAVTPPPARKAEVISRSKISLGIAGKSEDSAKISSKTLLASIDRAAKDAGVSLDTLGIELRPIGQGADQWSPDSELRFGEWEVGLPIEFGPASEVMQTLEKTLSQDPIWISSSSVGGRVAGDMISRGIVAMIASLLAIIAYVWFRFHRIHYGLAAVAALVHDVLVTLGAIAVSYWLASYLGFLQIEPFKISLTVLAALLTIIGYSLNDTIVIFDRIREVKGKSPRLTAAMINKSVTETLSRTLLTAITTLMVVVILYFFGGEGIHAFSFCMVIGVIAGAYSTVFIASPVLLWLVNRYDPEGQG
jgi:SecD/SecF fusion protein